MVAISDQAFEQGGHPRPDGHKSAFTAQFAPARVKHAIFETVQRFAPAACARIVAHPELRKKDATASPKTGVEVFTRSPEGAA
jgi:hypothetical protein